MCQTLIGGDKSLLAGGEHGEIVTMACDQTDTEFVCTAHVISIRSWKL